LNLLLEEKLDKELLESSMYDIGEEEKILEEKNESLNLQLEHEKEIKKRIESLKKALNNDVKLEKFDRHIFENLIEKVIVGSIDEDGKVDPYNLIFIYKTGLDNSVNGIKYKKDGRKKKSNVLPSNNANNVSVLSTNIDTDTCGDCSKDMS
jgi:hypothetical protein